MVISIRQKIMKYRRTLQYDQIRNKTLTTTVKYKLHATHSDYLINNTMICLGCNYNFIIKSIPIKFEIITRKQFPLVQFPRLLSKVQLPTEVMKLLFPGEECTGKPVLTGCTIIFHLLDNVQVNLIVISINKIMYLNRLKLKCALNHTLFT